MLRTLWILLLFATLASYGHGVLAPAAAEFGHAVHHAFYLGRHPAHDHAEGPQAHSHPAWLEALLADADPLEDGDPPTDPGPRDLDQHVPGARVPFATLGPTPSPPDSHPAALLDGHGPPPLRPPRPVSFA